MIFEGARNTNYTSYWNVSGEFSPDYELDNSNSLVELRKRCKQLIKDNSVAAGIQQAFINNIASSGPVIKVQSTSSRQKKKAEEFLDNYFNKIDISGTESLANIIEQIISWSFCDGDILINLPLDKKRKGVQTVVELIEAQRIATPRELEKRTGGNIDSNLVRHGVQYDEEGRIQGYWVKKSSKVSNFADRKENFDFFPMYKEHEGNRRRVTWLFKAPLNARPKASRQYPILTPVITLFKFMKDYNEAVLIGARVAACFSAFVKTNNPGAVQSGFTKDADGDSSYGTDGKTPTSRLQPGLITYLRPNEDIEFASPNKPSDNHDAFVERMYKTISMYVRFPYALLFLDLVSTSYSSWRGGVIETKKVIGRWRKELDRVIEWITNTILFEATIRGEIDGNFSRMKPIKRWPALGILDPEKEARANKIDLANKTTSKQRIADERGISYDELKEELDAEMMEEVELEAKRLIRIKELEEENDIMFADVTREEQPDNRDTSNTRREGEADGEDLDEDDATERRKEDGNF